MQRIDTTPRGGRLDESQLERDRHLVARCQDGDAGAFATLYDLYYERLVRFCRRRLANRHDAEDAAQDAFVRAWGAIGRLEPGSSFYPWLSVIAANRCTDLVRKGRRAEPVAEVPLAPHGAPADTVGDQLERRETAAAAGVAMRKLSPRHQRVLHLREELGLSVAQVAALEGQTPNATDTLLWRARHALQREFRALVDGAAGLGFVSAVALSRLARRAAHPLTRVADSPAAHGPMPWAPLAFAATLSVAGGVLATHVASPAASQPATTTSSAITGHVPGGVSAADRSSNGASADASHSSPGSTAPSAAGSRASNTASGSTVTGSTTTGSGGSPGSTASTSGAGGTAGVGGVSGVGAVSGAGGAAAGALGAAAKSAAGTVGGAVSSVGGAVGGAVSSVTNTAGSVANGVTNTAGGLANGLTSAGGGSGAGSSSSGGSGGTTTTTSPVTSILGGLGSTVKGTLQQTQSGTTSVTLP